MATPVWSVSENQRFERALAIYGTDEPSCWDRIAADVGGGKTAEDVKRHYDQLVDDIHRIEAAAGEHPNSNRGGAASTSTNGESNGRRPQT